MNLEKENNRINCDKIQKVSTIVTANKQTNKNGKKNNLYETNSLITI